MSTGTTLCGLQRSISVQKTTKFDNWIGQVIFLNFSNSSCLLDIVYIVCNCPVGLSNSRTLAAQSGRGKQFFGSWLDLAMPNWHQIFQQKLIFRNYAFKLQILTRSSCYPLASIRALSQTVWAYPDDQSGWCDRVRNRQQNWQTIGCIGQLTSQDRSSIRLYIHCISTVSMQNRYYRVNSLQKACNSWFLLAAFSEWRSDVRSF